MKINFISQSLKVVTVDDSPLIAERIDGILSEIENLAFSGHAYNISSARHLICKVNPNVVILDINLSQNGQEETGIDLLKEIRQDFPSMKIIIFTNHIEPHYRAVCLQKGADYFFDKSNDSLQIPEVLKQWTIKK